MPCSAERRVAAALSSAIVRSDTGCRATHASSTAVLYFERSDFWTVRHHRRAAQRRTTPTSASTHATSFVAKNVTNVYGARRGGLGSLATGAVTVAGQNGSTGLWPKQRSPREGRG